MQFELADSTAHCHAYVTF